MTMSFRIVFTIRCLLWFSLNGYIWATSKKVVVSKTAIGLTTTSEASVSSVEDVSSTEKDCACTCHFIYTPNMTQEQMEQEIQRIYDLLLLDRNNISAIVRKRISVPDSRPSAQSIGYVGVLVLVTSLGSIVALDMATLLRDVKAGIANMVNMVRKDFSEVNDNDGRAGQVEIPLTSSA